MARCYLCGLEVAETTKEGDLCKDCGGTPITNEMMEQTKPKSKFKVNKGYSFTDSKEEEAYPFTELTENYKYKED